MPRTCTACRHGDKAAIDAALVSATPRRQVARRYGLSETALRRHAGAHLPASLARAAEAGQVAESMKLLDQVEGIVADLARMERECRSVGDGEAYLRTARERLRALELLGRVTGEIQAGTTVNVVLARLGVTEDVARRAIDAYRQVEHLDEAARLELFRQALEEAGWRCMPPGRVQVDLANGGPDALGPA